MIRNIIGASIGRRMAGSKRGTRGAVLGMLAPLIVRRAFGPLGLLVGGGYLAKKYYDSRKERRTGTVEV